MSINYNAALAPYDNKGRVGMEELADSPHELDEKIGALAGLLRQSKCCIAIIGAGVSTAAGIADFRGPTGVWTMEAAGKDSQSIDFLHAHPTTTHYALVALEKQGILKWMVSQNVDGLCARSGFPMDRLAELHGNTIEEIGKDLKPIYCNNKISAERYKRSLIHLKNLLRECQAEVEKERVGQNQKLAADLAKLDKDREVKKEE